MPGTLSTSAEVRKAGIALKPAWVLVLSWARLGATGQALNLSHQGQSSASKALGEEGSPRVSHLACCLLGSITLRRYPGLGQLEEGPNACQSFQACSRCGKDVIVLRLVFPTTHLIGKTVRCALLKLKKKNVTFRNFLYNVYGLYLILFILDFT